MDLPLPPLLLVKQIVIVFPMGFFSPLFIVLGISVYVILYEVMTKFSMSLQFLYSVNTSQLLLFTPFTAAWSESIPDLTFTLFSDSMNPTSKSIFRKDLTL